MNRRGVTGTEWRYLGVCSGREIKGRSDGEA